MATSKQARTGAQASTDNTTMRSTVGQALMSVKQALMGIGWFSVFINLLMLTGPLYMLQVYDRVLVSRSMSTLIALSVLMVALYSFMGVLEFFRARVLVRVANRVEEDLGERTFKIWMKQGLLGQNAPRAAPLNHLSTIKQFLSGSAPGAFFDIFWVPIYIGVIFFLHWILGVFAIFGAIIIFISAIINELGSRKPVTEALQMRRTEQNFAQQAHRNAEVVEAMGMGTHMRNRWKRLNARSADASLIGSDRSGSATAFTKAFRMFVQSAILGLGGALAVQQIITPGAMIAGSIILGRALAPIQMLIGQWRSVTAFRDSYTRLNQFYEAVPEEEEALPLPEPKGFLAVENVVAGPPGAKTPTVMGLNFGLKAGEGMGVIGPSASGKSTLARLLIGTWMPQKGAVRLDGATFDQWNRDAMGRYVGYLPQNVELFDGTISENISRFSPDATPEAIVEAAKRAGVHNLILRLPSGYDTVLGEGGTVLSGGQVQRVALARALYGNPVLLILDEPNANLDADGDLALARAIKAARSEGATVIVMAHRPSAIQAVDKLLALKDGKQIAFGPKDEVLEKVLSKPKKIAS